MLAALSFRLLLLPLPLEPSFDTAGFLGLMGLSAVGCTELPPCSTSSAAADDKASPAAEEDKVAAADDNAAEAADAVPDLADVSARPLGRAVVSDLVDGFDGFMSLRHSVSNFNGLKCVSRLHVARVVWENTAGAPVLPVQNYTIGDSCL